MLTTSDQPFRTHLLGVLRMLAPVHVSILLLGRITGSTERDHRTEVRTLRACHGNRIGRLAIFSCWQSGLISRTAKTNPEVFIVVPSPTNWT